MISRTSLVTVRSTDGSDVCTCARHALYRARFRRAHACIDIPGLASATTAPLYPRALAVTAVRLATLAVVSPALFNCARASVNSYIYPCMYTCGLHTFQGHAGELGQQGGVYGTAGGEVLLGTEDVLRSEEVGQGVAGARGGGVVLDAGHVHHHLR